METIIRQLEQALSEVEKLLERHEVLLQERDRLRSVIQNLSGGPVEKDSNLFAGPSVDDDSDLDDYLPADEAR